MEKLFKCEYCADKEKEVPSIEGVVEDVRGQYGFHKYHLRKEIYLELKLKNTDKNFILESFPYRIDIGEKVVIYSDYLGIGKMVTVNGIQIFNKNNKVIFRASDDGYYFKEF